MSTFVERVSQRILPLSVKQTLVEAIGEWYFTGNAEDNELANRTCEMCGHEDIRYEFEIMNSINRNALWVGSKCILRFGVTVLKDGIALNREEARAFLDKRVGEMRQLACLRALDDLASSENNEILTSALRYNEQHGCLTPKLASVVFWRLRMNKIDHSPSFFKICLRRANHRKDLKEMETRWVHVLWPALSASQRKMAMAMGHRPPEQA